MHLIETLEKNIHELRDKLDSILLGPLELALSNCRKASEQIPVVIMESCSPGTCTL